MDKRKSILGSLKDTGSLLPFFSVNLLLEIKTLLYIMYHWTPPLNVSINLQPGSTSIVKLWNIPDLFPLAIIPWAKFVCMKRISNDKRSTGKSDKLNSLWIRFGLNPNRSLTLSSGVKTIWLPVILDFFMIEPKVENFDFIKKRIIGFCKKSFFKNISVDFFV